MKFEYEYDKKTGDMYRRVICNELTVAVNELIYDSPDQYVYLVAYPVVIRNHLEYRFIYNLSDVTGFVVVNRFNHKIVTIDIGTVPDTNNLNEDAYYNINTYLTQVFQGRFLDTTTFYEQLLEDLKAINKQFN